jgi:hypothetical protein
LGSENDYFPGKWDGANWISTGAVNTGTNTVSMSGLNSFSDFTAMDNTDSPLPVTLGMYEVNLLDDNTVNVIWSTLSELNNSQFEIYKTRDIISYELIGTIKGDLNSNQLKEYSFIDDQPYSGLSYYRLTQIDANGSVTHYDIKPINISESSSPGPSWNVFPNPSNNFFTLEGSQLVPNKEYKVSIIDNLSLLHFRKTMNSDSNGGLILKDPFTNKQLTGSFFVIIEDGISIKTIKLVVE